jgi:hypothetical protein
MNNSPRTELDDEECIDLAEEEINDWEKVTGPDDLGVIAEEN